MIGVSSADADSLAGLSKTELKKICERTGYDEMMDTIRFGREVLLPSRDDYVAEAAMCMQLDAMATEDQIQWNRSFKGLMYEAYTSFVGESSSDMHFILAHTITRLIDNYITVGIAQGQDPRLPWAHAMVSPHPEFVEGVEKTLQQMNDPFIDVEKSFSSMRTNRLREIEEDTFSIRRYNMNALYLKNDVLRFSRREEMLLLRMLVHIDPSALERLISGDVPDGFENSTPSSWYSLGVAVMWCVAMTLLYRGVLYLSKEEKQTKKRKKKRN